MNAYEELLRIKKEDFNNFDNDNTLSNWNGFYLIKDMHYSSRLRSPFYSAGDYEDELRFVYDDTSVLHELVNLITNDYEEEFATTDEIMNEVRTSLSFMDDLSEMWDYINEKYETYGLRMSNVAYARYVLTELKRLIAEDDGSYVYVLCAY